MSLRNVRRFLIARPRKKTVNPLLAAVQEAATELHAEGLIDRRRMRKHDALGLPSVQSTPANPFAPCATVII